MPLLSRHRRYLGRVAAVLLFAAMLGGLVPDPPPARRHALAVPPQTSSTFPGAALAVRAERYFVGNFDYRGRIPFLRSAIEYAFGTSTHPGVYIGRHGHLYYNDENTFEQSAGAIYRQDRVARFVDMADALRRALDRRGARLLVMIPPNAQSIATQDLPSWSSPRGPLEYDLALDELKRRGVAAIEVRTILRASGNNELYLRTDTHWRMGAALLAFNGAMDAIAHPEWKLDPAAALLPLQPKKAGDLAGFLGIQSLLAERDDVLKPAPEGDWGPIDLLKSPPYAGLFPSYQFQRLPVKNEGERILVLGDSFTDSFWQPLWRRTGVMRFGWLHHEQCNFDMADVERFDPTYVILAPTERAMPCDMQAWPKNLSHEDPDRSADKPASR